jgi:hypothetical protein
MKELTESGELAWLITMASRRLTDLPRLRD